jgi:hypothetical protein
VSYTPPTLLPSVRIRWGLNLLTFEQADNETSLRAMCDYGAMKVAQGRADMLAFDCAQDEVAYVRQYMAEKHPTVSYAFGSGQCVLEKVLRDREASIGRSMK